MERNNESNIQNGEDNDDDDDFEDFGGFEAADPVLPNVAQPAAGLQSGVQATPNPWAVFPSGNMQPDLLCGQNRFPAHLDTPTTVDVASGAVASVENGEPGLTSTVDRANGLFDMEHDLNNEVDAGELDLDQINLANDILDGSFRTASSQSGASFMSHGREQLPDISAFDLGISFERRDNSSVVNSSVTESQHTGTSESNHEVSVDSQPVLAPSDVSQNALSARISASEVESSSSRGAAGVSRETTNERAQSGSNDNRSAESAEIDSMRILLEQAELEKKNVQKELEEQLAQNTKLEEDLERARELAETAQLQYDKLQEEHKKQLDELRQAGHQSLTVVVEEYKELLKSTIVQQQQEWNQQVVEKMREESQRFTQLLEEQSEKFTAMQTEERQKNEDRMKEAVDEMREKAQAQFEKELSEERQKMEDRLDEAVQKERDKSQKEIERVIEEERQKAQQLLAEEQEKFKVRLSEEVAKTHEESQEALNKERQNSKEELEKMLGEERQHSRETAQQCVAATREEMKEHLQEQRKRDKALHQRQLASLDLFLESARHQLQILLDNNTEHSEDKDTTENS